MYSKREKRQAVLFGLIMMPFLTVVAGFGAYSKIDDNGMEAAFLAAVSLFCLIATVIHYRAFIIYVKNYIKFYGIEELWMDIHSVGIVVVVVGILLDALFLFMRLIADSNDPYIPDINRCLVGSVIGTMVGVVTILATRKKF